MTVYFNDDTIYGACGVAVFYNFTAIKNQYDSTKKTLDDNISPGGAGLICAGFKADDELCDEMFSDMADKYDVLFVSPKRLNRNSQNMFYFAVFSVKDVENDKYGFDDEEGRDEDDDE